MEFKDYYKLLGVDDTADVKTIKSAYRKLARKYHPDVSEERDAEEKFKEVTEAYEVLSDSDKRAEYDEIKKYGGQHGQSFNPPPNWQSSAGATSNSQGGAQYEGDFSEFFENIFGGNFRSSEGAGFSGAGTGQGGSFGRKGRDIETEMPIFLEDTLSTESKQIEYQLPHYDARGQRLADIKKTLKVKIPKGVEEGERIRLKGQGAPGIGDGPAGDLFLRIRLVPHPLFDVEGHNLIVTVPVSPWEAALGTKITMPTLEGKINLTIPKNSQSGQRLRVKERGLIGKRGKGDLYAVLNVVMPTEHSEESTKMWEDMAQKITFDPRAEWTRGRSK
ncbi:MAG: DnaJ domain-containing protein [Cellvibrionaceae bacterium]